MILVEDRMHSTAASNEYRGRLWVGIPDVLKLLDSSSVFCMNWRLLVESLWGVDPTCRRNRINSSDVEAGSHLALVS